MSAGIFKRGLLQRRCQGVIPAVQEPEKTNYTHDFHDLSLTKMTAQFGEVIVCYGIRILAGAPSHSQSRALSRIVEFTGVKLPDSRNFFRR